MAVDHLRSQFPGRRTAEIVVARAPGRINILGEHTDYNDGFVLPAATPQGTYVAAAPRQDEVFRVWTAAFNQRDEFDLRRLCLPADAPRWSAYARGVVWALSELELPLRGCDIAVEGDLPIGAGVASSASFEVALAMAIVRVAGVRIGRERIALLCRRAENEFVGVRCGILDQSAAVFGRQGAALLIDCRNLDRTPIALGRDGATFIVCDTRKPRGLIESEYNARRAQCETAARALGVRALRDVTPEDLARGRDRLDPETFRRARHVVAENRRVIEGAEALRSGDFERLGSLLAASHRSLRDDYEVSCPELEAMVAIASRTDGCLGARLMGAGFGGAAIALVAADHIEAFCRTVEEQYRAQTGLAGRTLVTWPSAGARVVVRAGG